MRRKKKREYTKTPLDLEYVAKRRADFIYYVQRSKLSGMKIAQALGYSYDWLDRVKKGKIMRPNDNRMGVTIDFIKDYERLHSYYEALLK
jgi:hypothetical protein